MRPSSRALLESALATIAHTQVRGRLPGTTKSIDSGCAGCRCVEIAVSCKEHTHRRKLVDVHDYFI